MCGSAGDERRRIAPVPALFHDVTSRARQRRPLRVPMLLENFHRETISEMTAVNWSSRGNRWEPLLAWHG